jgi:hypothetical protein
VSSDPACCGAVGSRIIRGVDDGGRLDRLAIRSLRNVRERVKKVLFHLHRKRLLQPDGSGAIQCASRGSGSPLPGGEHGDRGP